MATLERVEELINLIDGHLRELGEHLDHVQVLATWSEEGASYNIYRGTGNWFARQGMAQNFIQLDIAQDSAVKLAEIIGPKDED